MEMIIKIIIPLVCAGLNAWGGYSWHNARRFIMPVIIGAAVSYFSHCWWLGLTVLPVIGVLTVGYGEKSILYKYLSDAGARGTWMFLVAMVIGFGATITGHLSWFFYIPYCVVSVIIGVTLRNINQIVGDLIFGALFATVILFVSAS